MKYEKVMLNQREKKKKKIIIEIKNKSTKQMKK